MLNTEECLRDKQNKMRWTNTYVTGVPESSRENGVEAISERYSFQFSKTDHDK